MNRLRAWCALFFVWLFVLYNVERLHAPINLASFIYVLAAVVAVPVVIFSRLQQIPLAWLLVAVVPPILALKAWFGYAIAGINLPITITEIVAIWVTLALARQMGMSLEELRKAAVRTLITHLNDRTRPFDEGQAEIYREVRRARQHQRPLAVLAISPCDQSMHMALDRFTLELQQDNARNYLVARVAELLSDEMKDCDILSYHGSQFVTVLPEADRDQAMKVVHKLKKLAHAKLGIELRVGLSLFPDEEVTFVKLLERAEQRLSEPAPTEQKTVTSSFPNLQAVETALHEFCDDLKVS